MSENCGLLISCAYGQGFTSIYDGGFESKSMTEYNFNGFPDGTSALYKSFTDTENNFAVDVIFYTGGWNQNPQILVMIFEDSERCATPVEYFSNHIYPDIFNRLVEDIELSNSGEEVCSFVEDYDFWKVGY